MISVLHTPWASELDEARVAGRIIRHGDYLLCVELFSGEFPYVCEVTSRTGKRLSTPRFNNALSALAYAVTKIDMGQWK